MIFMIPNIFTRSAAGVAFTWSAFFLARYGSSSSIVLALLSKAAR